MRTHTHILICFGTEALIMDAAYSNKHTEPKTTWLLPQTQHNTLQGSTHNLQKQHNMNTTTQTRHLQGPYTRPTKTTEWRTTQCEHKQTNYKNNISSWIQDTAMWTQQHRMLKDKTYTKQYWPTAVIHVLNILVCNVLNMYLCIIYQKNRTSSSTINMLCSRCP